LHALGLTFLFIHAILLQGQFSLLYFFSRPVCSPIDALIEGFSPDCDETKGLSFKLVESLRPDWLFIEEEMQHFAPCSKDIENPNIHEDKCWLALEEGLERLTRSTQYVFLIEPNSNPDVVWNKEVGHEGVPGTIAKRLSSGKPIDDITVSYGALSKYMASTWMRLSAHSCQRNATCSVVPLQEVLCDEVKCHLYDPETLFAYFCDAAHLSDYGARRMVPTLRRAIIDAQVAQNIRAAVSSNGKGEKKP